MKKALFISFLLPLLYSCDDRIPAEKMPEESLVPQNQLTANESAITNYILQNCPRSRGGEQPQLVPYVVNGDTLMYVVNYEEGWELFSNDTKAPMVLMKSETGSFNPKSLSLEDPLAEVFDNTAEVLSEMKNNPESESVTNESWAAYSNTIGNPDPIKDPFGKLVHFKAWTVNKVEEFETMPLGGRLKTKWNQGFPYNKFTKIINNQYAKVGCGPLSSGQYLHWFHTHYGIPETTVTTAIQNADNSTFTYSGSSSEVWNSFLTEDGDTGVYGINATAVYLGYMGSLCKVKYGIEASPSYSGNIFNAINSQLGGIVSYVYNAGKDEIFEVMKNGYPILAISDGTFTGNGEGTDACHAYIIDYYVQKKHTITDFWAYRFEKEGEFIFDYSVFFDENTTKEDIEKYYKDGPVTEEVTVWREYFVKMNWGWGGYRDDVMINVEALTWTVDIETGKYQYNHPRIFYPKSINL